MRPWLLQYVNMTRSHIISYEVSYSLQVILRKRALLLVALLRKITRDLRHPMCLRHPVSYSTLADAPSAAIHMSCVPWFNSINMSHDSSIDKWYIVPPIITSNWHTTRRRTQRCHPHVLRHMILSMQTWHNSFICDTYSMTPSICDTTASICDMTRSNMIYLCLTYIYRRGYLIRHTLMRPALPSTCPASHDSFEMWHDYSYVIFVAWLLQSVTRLLQYVTWLLQQWYMLNTRGCATLPSTYAVTHRHERTLQDATWLVQLWYICYEICCQRVAVCCSMLQCVAVCFAVYWSVLQCVAVYAVMHRPFNIWHDSCNYEIHVTIYLVKHSPMRSATIHIRCDAPSRTNPSTCDMTRSTVIYI